jgi:hypothetical protein
MYLKKDNKDKIFIAKNMLVPPVSGGNNVWHDVVLTHNFNTRRIKSILVQNEDTSTSRMIWFDLGTYFANYCGVSVYIIDNNSIRVRFTNTSLWQSSSNLHTFILEVY